jgi:hypothetical protein
LRSKTSCAHDSQEVTNQLPKGHHAPTPPPRDAVDLAMDVLRDRSTFVILRCRAPITGRDIDATVLR